MLAVPNDTYGGQKIVPLLLYNVSIHLTSRDIVVSRETDTKVPAAVSQSPDEQLTGWASYLS